MEAKILAWIISNRRVLAVLAMLGGVYWIGRGDGAAAERRLWEKEKTALAAAAERGRQREQALADQLAGMEAKHDAEVDQLTREFQERIRDVAKKNPHWRDCRPGTDGVRAYNDVARREGAAAR